MEEFQTLNGWIRKPKIILQNEEDKMLLKEQGMKVVKEEFKGCN